MQKDTTATDVIFRIINKGSFRGDVIALMPHDCDTFDGMVASYQHIGQHSPADFAHCVSISRLATPEEYANLKSEMENGCGYKLNVIQKQNRDKFLKSYRTLRQNN